MKDKSLSLRTFETIKKDIVSLKYSPGSLLNEREIAENLGVSRTPVREAFQRLLQEGWVVSGNGNGKRIQVTTVSTEDVNEVIQIRQIVEVSSLELLFLKGEPKVLAGQLDSLKNKMEKSIGDIDAFTRFDLKYHSLIVASTHNKRLIKFWATIQEELARFFVMVMRYREDLPGILNEHELIVSALWEKDKRECLKIMKKHLKRNYSSILAHIDLSNEK